MSTETDLANRLGVAHYGPGMSKSGTDWINDALRHREGARTASGRIARQISAIAQLYGEALGHVLTLAHEDLAEHASEEAYAWEQALRYEIDRREEIRAKCATALAAEQTTVARLIVILREAVDYETQPARRRKSEPPWIGSAMVEITAYADTEAEPF